MPKDGKTRARELAERRRAEGKRQYSMWLTDEEKQLLDAVLREMREAGAVPASMRLPNGRFTYFDF